MLKSVSRPLLLAVVGCTALSVMGVRAQDASGRVTENATDQTQVAVPQTRDLIHFGDLIDVDIVGSTEFDWRGEVSPEGYLAAFRFSENGIFALCQTPETVAGSIRAAYSKFLNDPKISVSILDRSGRLPAVIYGAVRNQQRLKLLRDVNLAEVIVLSGGLTGIASGEISILRQPSANCEKPETDSDGSAKTEAIGSSFVISVNVADLIAGKPSANPHISYGDVITVGESPPVYVTGGIAVPSRIPFRKGLSLSRAVSSAGGLAKGAEPDRVTIFRRVDGRSEVIKADLRSIESGAQADIELSAYDIVDVAQAGRSDRRFAPVPDEDARSRKAEDLPLRVID